VLAGLSNAPQYVMRRQGTLDSGCIVAGDVDSVILPKDSCGGDGTLAFARVARKHKVYIQLYCTFSALDTSSVGFVNQCSLS
jgi:hypothetical protein